MSDETTKLVALAAHAFCDAAEQATQVYSKLKSATGFDLGVAGHEYVLRSELREQALLDLRKACADDRARQDREQRKRHYVVGLKLADIDGYVAGQVRGGRRSAVPVVTDNDPSTAGWRGYRPVEGDELVVLAGAIDGEHYPACIGMLQIMDRNYVFAEQLSLLAARLPAESE